MGFSLLSRFRPSRFPTQQPGTNGGMQRFYSSLVMLESPLCVSFCVRDPGVFVCHRCQIDCGVAWRTEPPSQPPSPSSVPPASHHSQLASVYLPPLSYPPLSVKLRLSPSSCCSLPPSPRSFKASSLLFYPGYLLHDLLENSIHRCSLVAQLLSPSRFPSRRRQDAPSQGLIPLLPLSLSPSPSLS